MSKRNEIRVPDIGDFEKVPVIEVLVAEGDVLEEEQSLVTLESDKATMEVPSPAAGTLVELKVKEGDEVSEGDVIGVLEVDEESGDGADSGADGSEDGSEVDESGPAAGEPSDEDDLGLKVALIERYDALGGVCLNVGCIPSKALLHVGQVIDSAAHLAEHGVSFGEPEIELDQLREFKQATVDKLTGGLAGMAKKRKVETITGRGAFTSAHEITVEHDGESRTVSFAQCIIAAGSRVMQIPGIPWDDERVMDSTGALELADVPDRLLIIGGGIIGLEMACVYRALGAKITVVEMMDQLMPGADPDLVKPLKQHLEKQGVSFHLNTKVEGVEASESALTAKFDGDGAPETADFDRVLVCVGRRPNGDSIDADRAGVEVTDRGFIEVDGQLRTNQRHIFAIGDLVGQPMLAHKASYEGKIAAEVAAGHKRAADARTIPSVAYTDPEVAWVGLTENQAKEQGLDYGVGKFPWAASGRALGMDRSEGFTKLLFDEKSGRVIGGGVVGLHAGDLIAEIGLAIEMGATAEDIGLTIHPHPTLSESVMMAAEMFEGTITDLYAPKKRSRS